MLLLLLLLLADEDCTCAEILDRRDSADIISDFQFFINFCSFTHHSI